MPWTLHSFCTRHRRFTDPQKLGLSRDLCPHDGVPYVTNIGLRRKLDTDLAFFVSYYEHGLCRWFRKGTGVITHHGAWDTVRVAGILIWTNFPGRRTPKTVADRYKSADAFLEDYTDFCNGQSEDDPHGC